MKIPKLKSQARINLRSRAFATAGKAIQKLPIKTDRKRVVTALVQCYGLI